MVKKNKKTASNSHKKHSDETDKKIPDAGENSQKNGTRKKKKQLSSRHRSTPKKDDGALRQALEQDGRYQVVTMSADGNCLFRSLSDQLYYDYGAQHDQVRSTVCDYLSSHPDDFSVFLVLADEEEEEAPPTKNKKSNNQDEAETDADNFESYVQNMRQDGTWGGHLELVAASRLYRRNITVFSANLAALTIRFEDSSNTEQDLGRPDAKKKKSKNGLTAEEKGPDLTVSFHDNDHYNSVRDNQISKSPKRPPPRAAVTATLHNHHHDDDEEEEGKLSTPPEMPSSESFHYQIAADALNKGEATSELTSNDPVSQSDKDSLAPTENGSEKEAAAPEASSTEVEEDADAKTVASRKVLKKSAPCPCGSGLRYKSCCWAKEKHAQRLQKLQAFSTDEKRPGPSQNRPEDDNDTNKEIEMNGRFRVLNI